MNRPGRSQAVLAGREGGTPCTLVMSTAQQRTTTTIMRKENKTKDQVSENEFDWIQTDLDQTKRTLTRAQMTLAEALTREEQLTRKYDTLRGLALQWHAAKVLAVGKLHGIYFDLKEDRYQMEFPDIKEQVQCASELQNVIEMEEGADGLTPAFLSVIADLQRDADKLDDDISFLEADAEDRNDEDEDDAGDEGKDDVKRADRSDDDEPREVFPPEDFEARSASELSYRFDGELKKTRDTLAGGVGIVADALVSGSSISEALALAIEDLSRAALTGPAARVSFLEAVAERLRSMRKDELAAEDASWDEKTCDDKEYPTPPTGLAGRLEARDILKQVAEQIVEPLGGQICWDRQDGA